MRKILVLVVPGLVSQFDEISFQLSGKIADTLVCPSFR
jgi:hypothetical protein